jgi:cobalt/nickel transport system permease protein
MHHHFIDRFAMGNSPIHRLDARAKLLSVLCYTVVLISFGRYSIACLAPMALLPLTLLWFGGVPVWFALRRVAILSPFILMLVLMSPIYDRAPHAVTFGPWNYTLSGGWLTAGNITIKFAFGVLALTAMMCTTRFALLLEAMRRLGMPQVIVVQLGFLYHYIFVLIDEAMRVRRAVGLQPWGALLARFSSARSTARSVFRSQWLPVATVVSCVAWTNCDSRVRMLCSLL